MTAAAIHTHLGTVGKRGALQIASGQSAVQSVGFGLGSCIGVSTTTNNIRQRLLHVQAAQVLDRT